MATHKLVELYATTTGAKGVGGCEGITTFEDGRDTQPYWLVTVKLNIPVAKSETLVLVPVPLVMNVPG